METTSIVQEIEITASADRVFEALTDPKERVQWWCLEGQFQATNMESDLRPGGAWKMTGIGRNGKPFTVSGVYRRVERPRLLEFTWIRAFPEDETETVVRFDLEERKGITTVRVTHSGFTSESLRERNSGWPLILTLIKGHIERKA